jgi:hypothetical protein
MVKSKLEIFEPIREYLLAAIDKCPPPDGLCYGKCSTDKREFLQKFYEQQNYRSNPHNLKHSDIPQEFVKRVLKVAENLKVLDRSATIGTLQGEVMGKVNSFAASASEFSGGVSKNINLEQMSQVGGVPFKTNKLVGSYSDDYLKGLTSEIKKVYNQFGGFIKTNKEVIGTIDDLNVLLHNNIQQQLINSLEKRYYKNYLTGGASSDVQKVLKVLRDGNLDKGDLDLFNAFIMVMELKDGDHATQQWTSMGPVRSDGLSINPKNEYRLNLKRSKIVGPVRKDDVNVSGKRPDLTGDDRIMKGMDPLLIRCFIPYSSGGKFEDDRGNLHTEKNWLYNEFDAVFTQGAGGRDFNTFGSLSSKLDCDEMIRKELLKVKENTAMMINDPYKKNPDIDDHSWEKRNDGTYQKNLADGSSVVYKEDTNDYNQLFSTANRCFGSQVDMNNENCCEWMEKVLKGDAGELLIFLQTHRFNWINAPKEINKAHPILVLKVLKAFGFREELVYDINSVGNGSKIWKIQNVNKWKTKYLDQKFKSELVNKVMENDELVVYLNLLVDYVNQNPSLINDHLVKRVTVIKHRVPDVLEMRGVIPCENPSKKNKYSTDWNELTKNINNIYGDFYKGLNFKTQLPFGMTNLFPSTQTFGYGNVYRGTTLFGGKPDGQAEVIIDVKRTVPQFTHQVTSEIVKLLDKLNNLNKPLSTHEQKNIKQKLLDFGKLETELYNQLNMINTYSQLASYFNKEDAEEVVSMQHIINYVNKYQPLLNKYENTKTGLEGLLTVLKDIADDDEENNNVLTERQIKI